MQKVQTAALEKLAHNIDVEEYAAVRAWLERFEPNANHHEIADVTQQVRYMMSACIDEMTTVHSSIVHAAFPQLPKPESYLEEDALSLNRLASRMSDLAKLLESLGAVFSEISCMPAVAKVNDLAPA